MRFFGIVAAVFFVLHWGTGCQGADEMEQGTDRGEDLGFALYEVQPDDTLAELSDRFGVVGGWPALAELNDLDEPDRLLVGQSLRIPRNPPRTDELEILVEYPRVEGEFEICDSLRHSPGIREKPRPVEKRWEIDDEGERRGQWDYSDLHRACATTDGDCRYCLETMIEEGEPPMTWATSSCGDQTYWELPVDYLVHEIDDFAAYAVDFGGGDSHRWVLAIKAAISMGLTFETWVLFVDGHENDAAPIRLEAADFRPELFVTAADGRGCDLLHTRWETMDDPLLGSGRYFTAQPMGFRGSEFKAVDGQPVMARRLLNDFVAERGQSLWEYDAFEVPQKPRGPLMWLANRATELRPVEDRGTTADH